MILKKGLTFDDVLLIPKFSKIKSRSKVNLSVKIKTKHSNICLTHPIIPSNMKHIMGEKMIEKIIHYGGLGIIDRFKPLQEQIDLLKKYSDKGHIGFSIGIGDSAKEDLFKISKHITPKIICIDIAHGDSLQCIKMIKYVKQNYNCLLIAGNVATAEGADRLWNAGADIVKAGIGPGSICTTRTQTGNGVPQLTALMDIAKIKDKRYLISDGGIQKPADMVKALCFADLVMCGSIFAGTDESNSNLFQDPTDNKFYKNFEGSSTFKADFIEGVRGKVKYIGPMKVVMKNYMDGIKSGCSYQGVSNLKKLKRNPEFIEITNSSIKESGAHDIIL